ncbi:hypothetical protein G9A89_004940 [Geosiphon pyriformis]|nr:hypothetical protein G9A89_004940 [Geosiphon pyriformis]
MASILFDYPFLDLGAFIVIKENLALFPASEHSTKVANLVKEYLRSIDNILLGFSLEHGIGTIPNLTKTFLEYQKAANAEDSLGQFFLGYCYSYGIGASQDRKKAFELFSKAAEAGNPFAQNNLGWCYLNGIGTTKNEKKAFDLFSKVAEAGHLMAQNNLGLSAEANNLSYGNNFSNLNARNLTLMVQDDLEHFMEFVDFEAFFDQLFDEFKCFKCGSMGIIITGFLICPFCDTDNINNDIFESRLPECLECYRTLKDPLWCNFCESLQFSKTWGTWNSGNHNINHYIKYTQSASESCREYLEWISPDEMIFLDQVGMGGFGVVKEGRWERGKILFWDKKTQKHERGGFIAHLRCAFCKYILEFYGITKDLINNEFSYSKDEQGYFYLIYVSSYSFSIISDLGFCCPADYASQSGKIYCVLEYLAPEICKGAQNTKYSDIYSFAIVSCEIISGERPLNNTDLIYDQFDVIDGKRPIIKKHTPQCIQEMIQKNWQYNPYYRDSADNCNLK